MGDSASRLKTLAVSSSIIALLACAPPPIASLTEAGHGFGTSEEEKKLLSQARRLHEDLDRKGLLLEDPELNRYIEQVGRPLVPKGAADFVDLRFYVLRLSVVNAFALPNGDIYLTVGLLARLDSEAELAQVQGHEISHVVLRHSLKTYESRRSSFITANIADLFLLGTSIAYFPLMTSLASYSREQEQEADKAGMQSALAAGYDSDAMMEIFVALKEVKKGEEIESSAYSSHPSNAERATVLRSLIQSGQLAAPGSGKKGNAEYVPLRTRLMAENIELKLNARQYELARDAADSAMSLQKDAAWPRYYRGEACRKMGDDPKGTAREHAWLYGKTNDEALVTEFEKRRNEFYASAEQAYRQALAIDPNYVRAERGLGLVHLRRGENEAARARLGSYLARNKDAPDRQYLNNLLKGIGQ